MSKSQIAYRLITITILLCIVFWADIIIGSVTIPLKETFNTIFHPNTDSTAYKIIIEYRLPKAITAILCGASLSVAGLLMQTLFRNPLAGPYVLGVSSGASLGVAIMVLAASSATLPVIVTQSGWGIVLAAILGSLLVLSIVLLSTTRINDTVSLLIVGMMFGSLTSSLVNILQSISNPDALKIFVVWTMGSLSAVTWPLMKVMAPILCVSLLVATFLQKNLNGMLLGENYARGLGISVSWTRVLVIIITCLLAGASTAFTGPIAFIGVAVPHIVRGIFKTSDHRIVMPASIITGALIVLLCDIISGLPGTEYTLPINSVSALVGAPVILWVILKNRHI